MEWYYKSPDATEVGPLSDDDFQMHVMMGRVTKSTPVRNDGLANFTLYSRYLSGNTQGLSAEGESASVHDPGCGPDYIGGIQISVDDSRRQADNRKAKKVIVGALISLVLGVGYFVYSSRPEVVIDKVLSSAAFKGELDNGKVGVEIRRDGAATGVLIVYRVNDVNSRTFDDFEKMRKIVHSYVRANLYRRFNETSNGTLRRALKAGVYFRFVIQDVNGITLAHVKYFKVDGKLKCEDR